MKTITDLTGERFGSFAVFGPAGSSGSGKLLWICVCDCGKIYIKTTSKLRSSMRKSNCKACSYSKYTIGDSFGYWTIVDVYKNNHGHTSWLCMCKCGTIKELTASQVIGGNTLSCRSCANNKRMSFDKYKKLLTKDDNPHVGTDGITLMVSCTYCGRSFCPEASSVIHRTRALAGMVSGEMRLYCSDECKNACPTYKKKSIPRGFRPSTSREVAVDLRKEVLKRDNWACQKCGATDKQLHVHHERPAALSPLTAHDPDVCITLCKDCHKEVHQKKGCRYVDLHRKECQKDA